MNLFPSMQSVYSLPLQLRSPEWLSTGGAHELTGIAQPHPPGLKPKIFAAFHVLETPG